MAWPDVLEDFDFQNWSQLEPVVPRKTLAQPAPYSAEQGRAH
jgi:hypothetical protein